MAKAQAERHAIGEHIRKSVLPAGMPVSEASRLLNVSRPTLSNLLNGNAALSPDMAQKLEHSFGVKGQDLLELQTTLQASQAQRIDARDLTQVYVPPFLKILANDITAWAGGHNLTARSRLAVFLRVLVNSTNSHLTRVDFPGNDDSERPGSDGFTDSKLGTPWVPGGKTHWEFGVNESPKGKADHDYEKSLSMPKVERHEATFIFVTPRRWPGKTEWAKIKHSAGDWKEVRAYDSSDLEQWLEQSIPAQAWFANEANIPSQGVKSLDDCWRDWSVNCQPELDPVLFSEAISSVNVDAILAKLNEGESVTIAADSRSEGLAFLSCLFQQEDRRLMAFRDRIAIFTESGILPRLITRKSSIIPVVFSDEVERELFTQADRMANFVIRSKNVARNDADITLETLGHQAFRHSLEKMLVETDRIEQLAHESGRSLTVLRRRLSRSLAIKTPAWSADDRYAKFLAPMALVGTWDSRSKADKDVVTLISNKETYDEVEREILELLDLEDSPVWIIGNFNGVVSKLDSLFAICNCIGTTDLERFFEVAELALSEDDPALDLPEDERWMAGVKGKKRDISGAVREGIIETLVILSFHGNDLFPNRLDFNPADRVARLIRNLLTPLTGRKLESHSQDLPLIAEAAPEAFLNIIEDDLGKPEPVVFEIVRPTSSSLFGSTPRTGLLWALEGLAWKPEMLVRVVGVLARLATKRLDDNLMNKPSATLSAIFRSWMPQTAASLTDRIAALDYLVREFPEVAWPICIEQFDPGSRVGHYSHKPRWRPDARGAGQFAEHSEMFEFNRHALDQALNWPTHTASTLGDLVTCIDALPEEDQSAIWRLAIRWSEFASDAEKSKLRETIRTTTMTRRATLQHRHSEGLETTEELANLAREAFERLLPNDPVQKHAWLFLKAWVDESADEAVEDQDWRKREERLTNLRRQAVKEVYEAHGPTGLIELARLGETGYSVGWAAVEIVTEQGRLAELAAQVALLDGFNGSLPERALMAGLLAHLSAASCSELLSLMRESLAVEAFDSLLLLTPFNEASWNLIADLGQEIEQRYWLHAGISWVRVSDNEREFAIDKLLEVGRPRAVLNLIRFHLEKVSSQLLFRILNEVTGSNSDLDNEQIDGHTVGEIFKILNQRGEMSISEMASLEFRYLSIFERDESAIPNLQKQIDLHPELFVQAISFVFRRSDKEEDPKELQALNPGDATARAKQAYRLLDLLRQTPGRNENGQVEPKALIAWIVSVRALLKDVARTDIGDTKIGELLAKSEMGHDGVWPSEGVRNAMEQTLNKRIAEGFKIGKFNLRGVHMRGEGGAQERALASDFDRWASALSSSHPKVAKVLRDIRDDYSSQADREDADAKIRKRLHH